MKLYLQKHGFLIGIAVVSLIALWDWANIMIVLQALGVMALMILFVSFALDDRKDKGLFPHYDESELIQWARAEPLGAAAIVAIKNLLIIVILILAFLFVRPAHSADIPAAAKPLLPVLSQSINNNWPTMPLRQIPAGQVEQESSWKAHATLKTSRELGRGLTQMTIAYNKNGKERFNIYKSAIQMKPLKGWDWKSDPYNVRYQLTFLILQDRSNYETVRNFMENDTEAWKAALVCYNAGAGRWLQRRAVAKANGIPANRWDGGLDQAFTKGESAILYGRPLWQAVNEYPRVIFKRSSKYTGSV